MIARAPASHTRRCVADSGYAFAIGEDGGTCAGALKTSAVNAITTAGIAAPMDALTVDINIVTAGTVGACATVRTTLKP